MPKYVAPKGTQGIHIGGAYFAVDKDGLIDLPEGGEYKSLLPAEYVPYEAPVTDGVYPPAAAPAAAEVADKVAAEDAPAKSKK